MMLAAALGLAAASLYEQAVVRLLHERFDDERISYMLVSAGDGRVVDARWPEAAQPVSPGSLLKPFTAMAYGEIHEFRFPELTCRGAASGCWLPAGHGRLGITEAIAQSCNAYFDALAEQLRSQDVAAVAHRFGFAPAPERAPPSAWVGRAGLWVVRPVEMARAFAQLASDPSASVVLRGMERCARSGTARAIGGGLAKTGTAPCVHHPAAPGDGFVIAIDSGYAVLVRVHGVPGAEAASVAARILRVVREGR